MTPARWKRHRPVPEGQSGSLLRRVYRRRYALAAFYGLLALAGAVVSSTFGNVHSRRVGPQLMAWIPAAALVVFGTMATRRIASLLGHIVAARSIRAAGVAIRVILTASGYLLILFVTLAVLDVSITHLLVGGALTGVILGIAAQQSLGNLFAGIVLLLARPFAIGDHIRVRSGPLGGAFDGTVLSMSLTYLTIQVDGGPLKIPNSVMLGAAVGPFIEPKDPPDTTKTVVR